MNNCSYVKRVKLLSDLRRFVEVTLQIRLERAEHGHFQRLQLV